jgi:hypothetical protein
MLAFTGVMTPTNLGALARQVQNRARQRAGERATSVGT